MVRKKIDLKVNLIKVSAVGKRADHGTDICFIQKEIKRNNIYPRGHSSGAACSEKPTGYLSSTLGIDVEIKGNFQQLVHMLGDITLDIMSKYYSFEKGGGGVTKQFRMLI